MERAVQRRSPMKTQQTFGEVVQAAFAEAARRTKSPRGQARIAAELIARMLRIRPQPRLTALLGNG